MHRSNGRPQLADPVLTLPSLRLVQPPRKARVIARLLAVIFLLSPVALIFVPWQQYVSGSGSVVAFDPVDRPQEIDAPISGRIERWHVVEGSVVEAGDPILDIVNNDPEYLSRLQSQREAERIKLEAYQQRVELVKLEAQLIAQARDLAITAAQNKLEVARARVKQAEAAIIEEQAGLVRNTYNYNRQRQLVADGLAATQDVELAEMSYNQSRAGVTYAQAALVSAQEEVKASQAELERVTPSEDAKIRKVEGELKAAEGLVESTKQAFTSLETQISQQLTQFVKAPRDGIIFRILANKTLNGQIIAGEPLVLLVPDVASRVAEIYVDGNDAPLIQKGDPVRLQFEGWPAVQFVGWPSVAVGTFGGEVILVDSTSNDMGKFRVLVGPSSVEGEQPWPEERFLRQGVRAKGFVLLQQVALGYELWRRLNGFPPVLAEPPGSEEKVKVKRPK